MCVRCVHDGFTDPGNLLAAGVSHAPDGSVAEKGLYKMQTDITIVDLSI